MDRNKSQKRTVHITCSYARVPGRIMLKIDMTSTTNVTNFTYKFEKDPFSGSREIGFLLYRLMSTLHFCTHKKL